MTRTGRRRAGGNEGMAAEFYVRFVDGDWYRRQRELVEARIAQLPSFTQRQGDAFWLKGPENAGDPEAWAFDARVFVETPQHLMLEISARPPSVQADLIALLAWIRSQTAIVVEDEDGGPANW